MRLIDADELIEHVWRDRLDSRERIANLVKSMPTVQKYEIDTSLYSDGFADGYKQGTKGAQSIDITKKIPFYRAKHINSDRYEDGFYFAMPETTYCVTEDYERHPVKIHHFIINHRMSDWGLPNRTEGTEIDPDTLKFIGWFAVRDSYGAEPWIEGENNGD